MPVCVVTDPSAVMPRRWLERSNIRLVPLDIAWADGTTDPGDLSYGDIARRLADEPVPPKTGAPSPGSYATLIEESLVAFEGVLVVCPSSELSTTYSSAVLAAQQISEERVRVLDSRTAAAGQGLVAEHAARASDAGADLRGAAARASEVASKVNIWATLGQLRFLSRSGRLPAIAAAGAGALGLQPVVRYAGGSPAPVAVVRSTRRGADRLVRAWERTLTDGRLYAVAFHSDRMEDAQHIRARIVERVGDAEAEVVEVSASLAAHTGPGLLGLAWFWDERS